MGSALLVSQEVRKFEKIRQDNVFHLLSVGMEYRPGAASQRKVYA